MKAQLADACSELSIRWIAANAFLHAFTKDMVLTSDPRFVSLFQLLLQSNSQVIVGTQSSHGVYAICRVYNAFNVIVDLVILSNNLFN